MISRVVLCLCCALVSVDGLIAQTARAENGAATVFLVRHAERADTEAGKPAVSGSDPDLSATGHARARSLAMMLKDAAIRSIFVTEYKRTQQTAAPLAEAIGVKPTVITSKDVPGLVAKLKSASENVLVVGHSNSVPEVIKGLGAAPVPIGDNEFDQLFIVTGTAPALIQLRYK